MGHLTWLRGIARPGYKSRWSLIRTGVRADGVIGSSIGFAAQIGNTIGGAIGIAILGAVGYVAHADLSSSAYANEYRYQSWPRLCFAFMIIPFMMIRMTNKKGRENETKVKAMTENEQ